MTTDTHTTFDLPTEAEYAAVEEIVSGAQEAVEKMAWRLAPLLNPDRISIPSQPVSAADIGLLWSFLEFVQLEVGAIRRDVKNGVKPALGYLNAHRLTPEDSA